jgi:PAS domain S-box-containing protein
MSYQNLKLTVTPNTPWIAIVSATLICISVSLFSLMSGWLTIFQNLFYIPIIIACVYYTRKGFVFSVILSGGYFILMAGFSRDPATLQGALVRVLIFILIAAIITYLSEIRQATETALRESEGLYRTLVEKAHEAIIIVQDDVFVFVNARMAELLEVTVGELAGKSFVACIHPDDRERVMSANRKRISGEIVPGSGDFRIMGANGRVAWVSITGVRIQWKDRPATLNLLTDITGRRQAEEDLRNSEEFNRGLVENIPDIVAVYGTDRKIRFVNPAVYRVLGYRTDLITGTDILSYVPEDQQEKARAAIAERISSGSTQPIEIDLIGRDGRLLTVMTRGTITNFRNEHAVLLLMTDISSRKKYEQEMKEHTEETERYSTTLAIVNKKLNLLGSLMRHDIINKLAVISAYSQILKKNTRDPEDLSILEEQVNVVRMINDYLVFTKMYEKIGVTAPVWLSVADVIRRVFSDASPAGVTLEEELGELFVWSDPLLEKVFSNLLDNATRHGGRITKIRVSSRKYEDGVAVTWEDDGVGILPDEKENIFVRGYGKNTGLGLFLVREILGITGITITETGEPGKGARFEILVPGGSWQYRSDGPAAAGSRPPADPLGSR